MLNFAKRIFGATRSPETPVLTAVLIDPYVRTIREVTIPSYRAEPPLYEPVDQAEFTAFCEAFRTLINQEGRAGFRSGSSALRNDCIAACDDEGLLHDDAGYWRLEFASYRPIRAGRYVIYGCDGTPKETSVPTDLGETFWRDHVRWIDKLEGRELCRAESVTSTSWLN